MVTRTLAIVTAALLSVLGCSPASENPKSAPAEIVLLSDVKWEQLNPLRRDKSPKAGTLWGDRTGPGPAASCCAPSMASGPQRTFTTLPTVES